MRRVDFKGHGGVFRVTFPRRFADARYGELNPERKTIAIKGDEPTDIQRWTMFHETGHVGVRSWLKWLKREHPALYRSWVETVAATSAEPDRDPEERLLETLGDCGRCVREFTPELWP